MLSGALRERALHIRVAGWLLSLLYADAVLVSRLKLHVGDERPGATCSILTVLLQISKVDY